MDYVIDFARSLLKALSVLTLVSILIGGIWVLFRALRNRRAKSRDEKVHENLRPLLGSFYRPPHLPASDKTVPPANSQDSRPSAGTSGGNHGPSKQNDA